jgi:cardiolipin synthase C
MQSIIRIITLTLLLLLIGCASTPKEYHRVPSTAIKDQEMTTAGQFIKDGIEKHPGKSGFHLLASGKKAFTARNAMTQIAEKTIDVQYFVWQSDSIGAILVNQLIKASERGVRVRMLIDDYYSGGRDFGFTKLDLLANFEVRVFNPYVGRDSQLFEFMSDMSRLNHRMHNKAFIMDNTYAIIGGRNIGDEYFGVSAEVNFRDLDVLTAGPIVKNISDSFDVFWNSEWAIPIASISTEHPTLEETSEGLEKLQKYVDDQTDFPYPIHRTAEEIYQRMQTAKDNLIWADAEILYDDPNQKIGNNTGYQGITLHLRELGKTIKEELLIEAAYFIAGERGVKKVREYKDKGVRVRVLTNSMATNDMASAFVFYEKYRKDLLQNGLELYELKPDLDSQRKFWSLLADTSIATLHTKVLVADRKYIFIGSYNLDPRSDLLNTEVGLLIESPELAEQIITYMNVGTDLDNSYHLILEKESADDDADIVWITEDDDKEVRYDSDPHAGFWRPISAWFISLFPIEEHI